MIDTVNFREMVEEDIDQIMEIEYASFSLPWSIESFISELRSNKFAVYIVVEDEHQVFGYCGMWLIVDEAHITNIAILPQYRGKKYGVALLSKIMDIARANGAKTMTLEVRMTNTVAKELYRKLGFQPGAIRKNYYTDNHEDALVMWVNL